MDKTPIPDCAANIVATATQLATYTIEAVVVAVVALTFFTLAVAVLKK